MKTITTGTDYYYTKTKKSLVEFIDELKKDDFQWIWGTLSLFESNVIEDQIRQFDVPDICANPEVFVTDVPIIQHPLAILEINPFDKNERIFAYFKAFYSAIQEKSCCFYLMEHYVGHTQCIFFYGHYSYSADYFPIYLVVLER